MSIHKDPRAEYRRKWYQQNKERAKSSRKARYEANKEETLQKQAIYREKNRDRINARSREYNSRPEVKERRRAVERARAYGLTVEQAAELDSINNCQSCGTKLSSGTGNTSRNFDHCHSTGAFRGVLCGRCNKALGLLDDDPVKVQALTNYLKNHVKE